MERFKPSIAFTVGMEVELQLLDATTLDLADRVLPMLEAVADVAHVKPEFVQDTVEVITDPQPDVAALERDVRARVAELLEVCRGFDLRLAGAGTHPFATRLALITPRPRYEELEEASGLLGHTQVCFATHVHLGLPDGDEAVRLMNEIRPYLPVLLTLSANSPYWRGYETRFASYRHRLLAAIRSCGQPPAFAGWDAFAAAIDTMIRAGVVASLSDVHWDLRPRPALGTLEVRVMDAQSCLAHSAELAAFVRALARYLQDSRDAPGSRPVQALPWWIERDNAYVASRYGRDARMVIDAAGRTVAMADLVERLLACVAPHAAALGEGAYLATLAARWRTGLGYERRRAALAASGSFVQVVREMADDLSYELSVEAVC
jgi:carboxylate-amine ligase